MKYYLDNIDMGIPEELVDYDDDKRDRIAKERINFICKEVAEIVYKKSR